VKGLVVVASEDPGDKADPGRSEQEIVELARRFGMRLVGPECMGVINTSPEISMNASLASTLPPRGPVAFSSQSGGLGLALLGEIGGRGLGISSFVSVGHKADVSGNDLLRFWAQDDQSEVILLYLESFGNPRKFSRIARRVARKKPVVAVKSARTAAGARGARAQGATVPDEAIDALFRQAGVIRVATLEELLEVAELLASQPLPRGRAVAVVGNGGGCGVLVADACESYGLEVPELAPSTRERLLEIVSAGVAIDNPLALSASATAAQYRAVLETVLADEGVSAAIVTFMPPGTAGSGEVAEAVASAAAMSDKPVLANFTATPTTLLALERGPRHVPFFAYPESAARALSHVVPYGEWLRRPEGSTPSFDDVDLASVRRIVSSALEGSGATADSGPSVPSRPVWLETASTFALLGACGIPTLAWARASSVSEAVAQAGALGYPVALKLDAPSLVHKSDVGGVRLNLASGHDVTLAAEVLFSRFGPDVSLIVQPMAPEGVETVVGLVEDPSLGPLVMFGLGGKQAELFRDQIWSLVPMTSEDADELVGGLRSSPLLTGYRGSATVDLGALAEVLSRVALLAEDVPEIAELSLNPVVASPGGAVVLDARIRVTSVRHEPSLLRRTMRVPEANRPAGAAESL
jgi:acyl-CoA synthetase (NDP forming)